MTASLAIVDAYRALFRGAWDVAARTGLVASANSNFATEGAAIAAHAAIAGDLHDDLSQVLDTLRASPFRVRLNTAAIASAEGGLAAREGRLEEAQLAYRQALELRRQAGNHFEEALTGLEWGRWPQRPTPKLRPRVPPARHSSPSVEVGRRSSGTASPLPQ